MITKKELRRNILAIRSAMEQDTVKLYSKAICDFIIESDAYKMAADICLYMPIRNEVDVTLMLDTAWKDGKKIWLPRIIDGLMEFYYYDKSTELVADDRYHIPEPQSDRRLAPGDRTLVVMPGAVFSVHKDRIGYGGGYYDRYLSKYPMCNTIAVCYNFQIVDDIQAELHDIKPDVIVSEAGQI